MMIKGQKKLVTIVALEPTEGAKELMHPDIYEIVDEEKLARQQQMAELKTEIDKRLEYINTRNYYKEMILNKDVDDETATMINLLLLQMNEDL